MRWSAIMWPMTGSMVARRRSLALTAPGRMRHPQVLADQPVEHIRPEPAAPVAQPQALVRHLVLEVEPAGEVLEIGVAGPARPQRLVGEVVHRIQHQHAKREPCRRLRPSGLGEVARDLLLQSLPVDPVGQPHQRMAHVDEALQRGLEQTVRLLCRWPSRPHRLVLSRLRRQRNERSCLSSVLVKLRAFSAMRCFGRWLGRRAVR